MAGLNRRDFLKALGFTGSASVVSACGFDQNYYRTPIEEILPYVVRPEQITPGTPTFFATTVTTGAQAFPVLARHRDGRVVNVGANAKAVPNAPAIPRAAFFELQRHYSPDRIKAPTAAGQAVAWDAALGQFADAVKAARDSGKKVAYFGPGRSGSIVRLIRDFTADGPAVFWEPLGREAEALAAERLFGQRLLPAYDLSKAQYILSFGADFLGTWGNTATASQYADARNPNKGNFVARFALVSPHRGQTGANADDWFKAKPGSEANVAFAVAKLVAERLGKTGGLADLLAGIDIDAAATAADLTRADLDGIAAQFAAGTAVALPGGVTGASIAATDLAMATYVLNLVSDNGGKTFGVGPTFNGPIDAFTQVESLIADMAAGNVGVLIIDDHTNPLYALPASTGFADALAKVGLVVSLSSHPDETTAAAKLILPTADAFEDWGDEEPAQGRYLLRQPSMSPLAGYDVRSLGDILLATARAMGMAAGQESNPFEAKTWRDYVAARWAREVHAQDMSKPFDLFWTESLERGGVEFPVALANPTVIATSLAAPAAAEPAGAGKYFLIAYPHPFRFDGRYANQPWAQEVPDPMTGQVWDSWLEVHPNTAAALGLPENGLVTLTTPQGSVDVGITRYRGVREDVVAFAFGNGHAGAGRYAEGIGQNVVKLLAAAKDSAGALAWQTARVDLTSKGTLAGLVTTFGSDVEHKRDMGVTVAAAELAKVGDSPAEKPGELAAVPKHQLDERLQKAGITDFYGMPDHPTYRFGMTVDVNACNGCGVCAIACYSENNLPVVGKQKVKEGREMGWIRVDRFWEEEGYANDVRFVPMMCQHCGHAPCESVCPVLATYHTIDGLNAMVYNRCVGTRYCANNCPYKARRFNWHSYVWPEPFNYQLNPEVSTRTMGVMEKCTFCVQRIRSAKSAHRNKGFTNTVPDSDLRQLPACAEACPSQALTFGSINDEASIPAQTRKSTRSYVLFADLHTFPAINYLAKASFHPVEKHHGGGHHAAADAHGAEGHGEAHENTEHHAPAAEGQPAEHH
jgi:Fe-S-cluster-containing dehydrogenase component/anaerobic selenocysteine-containing dehydrogenase